MNQFATMQDADAMRAIKEEWVATQLKSREKDFTDYQDLRFFVGTWNVNGKLATESLQPWFSSFMEDQDPLKLPDLLVLGFQEIDLSAEAFLLNDSPREEYWSNAIKQNLGWSSEYFEKLQSKQLVGILMIVFVKKDLLRHVAGVSSDSAGCGIMGMMGNKGGVAVRFRIFDSWVCFINSHLAADSKEVERRNQDYAEICKRLRFDGGLGRLYDIWRCE